MQRLFREKINEVIFRLKQQQQPFLFLSYPKYLKYIFQALSEILQHSITNVWHDLSTPLG